MKRSLKISLILFVAIIVVAIFNPLKTFAVVRPDGVDDTSNTGIVINGTTIVENGKVVANVANVSYDTTTNTLTLNNFKGNSVRWVGMGKDFRINIVGNNTVGTKDNCFTFTGPVAGEGNKMYTNVKFIGNGTLNIISTLLNSGDLVIDGPTINVTGAVVAYSGKVSVQRGTLSIKATHDFFEKAFNGEKIEFANNINVTDGNGKTVYYAKKALEYTIEENPDGTKTYWVVDENGNKSGYETIPYVEDFCYTKEYSKENVANSIVMKEKNVTINKEENTTKIKLNTNSNAVPSNTVLIADVVTNKDKLNSVKESLKETSTKYVAYDITLTTNNVSVQPNGNVKISIPIPDNYDKTKLSVYRIADNGDKTKYDVTTEGNYAIFETNHFSTYVLAEENIEIAKTEPTNNENKKPTTNNNIKNDKLDETPKTGNIEVISIISFVAIISLVGVVILKRNNK